MSHYFSRVRLLPGLHQRPWLRELARQGEAYRDHALIWRLFPGDGLPRDFLFRRLDDARSYYIVSARPPLDTDGLFQVQTKPYAPALQTGEALHFDLRANPVVSRRRTDGRAQRHDVLMDAKRSATPEQQAVLTQHLYQAGLDWLLKRAPQWGLRIDPASVLQKAYTQHRLRPKGKTIEFSSLDYQGVAEVSDADQLKTALLSGVGHGKGFGCGLLLLKRV